VNPAGVPDLTGAPALTGVPARSLDARIRKVSGSLFLAGREDFLELSETAALIWRRIDGRRTVREIAEAVAAEYDVDAGTVREDVLEFVRELLSAELITLHRETEKRKNP
jgi:Coenzyme PQQ synthesis protein D (PqqD)